MGPAEPHLSAFLPDEAQAQAQAILHAHAAGHLRLEAPALLVYEITDAVWQAGRRARISSAQADEILRTVAGLDIALLRLDGGEILPLARQYERSAYEAAYLTLAQRAGEPLVTADKWLYITPSEADWIGLFGWGINRRNESGKTYIN